MAKEIVNKTAKQRIVKFKDGTSVILKRGQKMVTEREIKNKEEGVVAKDVSSEKQKSASTPKKPTPQKSTQKKTETESKTSFGVTSGESTQFNASLDTKE